MKTTTIKRQLGLTIVEFTLIASALMLTLFGAFEVGRYVFTYQMMNEMTRKAARLASVCAVDSNIPNLPRVQQNYPPNFQPEKLVIDYLRDNGQVVVDPTNNQGSIYFVRARVDNYQYQFIPLLNFIGNSGALTMPSFETVLPRESLGISKKITIDEFSGLPTEEVSDNGEGCTNA
ncbi:TadE/TadG family type IV pilus assembly protein [Vibrio sp. CK2-1]|uniref:TadE/TadG family type IV pilus assembly protein n=1 Tax=Vibrio sp. CK2-1 TaxID=2912249 RepID=UPI001F4129CD|nr:TadE/TadG family type IV pilus assembly protein [Vibrio sp. CK2-1]MCF7354026.1 pilus assembly protein [Vibrio sp. CK2-1]